MKISIDLQYNIYKYSMCLMWVGVPGNYIYIYAWDEGWNSIWVCVCRFSHSRYNFYCCIFVLERWSGGSAINCDRIRHRNTYISISFTQQGKYNKFILFFYYYFSLDEGMVYVIYVCVCVGKCAKHIWAPFLLWSLHLLLLQRFK